MSCHCAYLKNNEIKVIMTPGGNTSISIIDAHIEDENILILTMSNGQIFTIDLSEVPVEDVIKITTKDGKLFVTLNDEIFEVKEEEGE